jgi:hypothetical protein
MEWRFLLQRSRNAYADWRRPLPTCDGHRRRCPRAKIQATVCRPRCVVYGGFLMLKIVAWVVGIIFVIGLLVVTGVLNLIF